jgi:hypothetical protein
MKTRIAVIVLLVFVCLGWWLVTSRVQHYTPASKRSICGNNLKQIGFALENYHRDHGTFPPAYVPDDNGQPSHSWRVLILPYLEERSLYDKYRFDEPWNGPNNAKLGYVMPNVFRCPSFASTEANAAKFQTHTNYMAIISTDSVLSGNTPVALGSVTDPSNTIMITESATRMVHWMAPRDLSVKDAFNDLHAGVSSHGKGVIALCADGAVRFMTDETKEVDFYGLVSRSRGESAVPLKNR